ncbi:uncharacterized protein LOC132638513 isoform X2 [Lycium barbarum]|nr:uncharacterized protein LOC132638513 isoform X2 [Lycium barbarum]
MSSGEMPDIGVTYGNESGDTLKASTEEIQDGGDISAEHRQSEKVGVQHPADTTINVPDVVYGATTGIQKDEYVNSIEGMVAKVLSEIPLAVVFPQDVVEKEVGDRVGYSNIKTPPKPNENVQPLSEFLLPDEMLPSQIGETRIIVHPSVARARKPSKHQISPFMTNYCPTGTSSVSPGPCMFKKKHPFVEDPINMPRDTFHYVFYASIYLQ